ANGTKPTCRSSLTSVPSRGEADIGEEESGHENVPLTPGCPLISVCEPLGRARWLVHGARPPHRTQRARRRRARAFRRVPPTRAAGKGRATSPLGASVCFNKWLTRWA